MPLEALYFGDLVIADAEESCNDMVDSAAVKCNRRKSVSRHRKQRKYGGHRYRNETNKVDLSRAFYSRGGYHRHGAALMNSRIGVFRRPQHVGVKSVNRHLSKGRGDRWKVG